MARIKRPENETPEEAVSRRILESVANHATRSEKTSWYRKYTNMQDKHKELQPIEEQILDLMAKKQPIMDEITEMRQVMVHECIHPYELLVLHENYVECKFCNKKMSIPSNVR